MLALTSTDHERYDKLFIPVGTNMHMSGVALFFENQGLTMLKTESIRCHLRLK